MDALVQVRAVNKIYGHGEAAVRALDDVTLDLLKGEIMLLVGPSGSGKTTLLSVMGCILTPTSGSVRVLGDEVSRLRECDRAAVRRDRIGFVFQGFNLFPTLTALQNVALALDVKGIVGRSARTCAVELLHAVGLDRKLDVYPGNLSGGQKQRLAIARALAGHPPIILADEPTAALDSKSGRDVIVLLQELAHEHGCGVTIVTHDVRMLGYADRIVQMEDGHIADDERPAHEARTLHELALHGAPL